MPGMHAFEPQAKASIDLESFVAEGHFLRQIDRVLNLKFVRELTAACYADGQGRPSIDPEVFFRMQLVAYFYGITTDRRLCEEVRYNLAYRWFCRLALEDEVPDHSSLSRIRDRYGENIFEGAFREIVTQCKQKGLVKDACRVMTDATLIAADASLNSLVHNDPGEAKREKEAQHDRWSGTTQAIQSNASQLQRPRHDAGAEAGNAPAAQIQSASDHRCRQSDHSRYRSDNRWPARQPALSGTAPTCWRKVSDYDS
jgi:transposase